MEKIKSWINKTKKFVLKNKKEVFILGAILLIGAFFRLYRISDYMTFLGDEGRDVIIVRRIFTENHPPLIGPGTSIGSMYLGPLYYYMMAPALLLAGFSPVGPAVQIAILGVVTIGLVWWVGREWFGKIAGLIAAGLYAISPTVIIFSRSSWNPNIMPFFALLSIYSIWRVWKKKEYKWLAVASVCFAFVLQSHYLGLLLLPTLAIFWYLSKVPLRQSLKSLLIFAALMSPLLFFDLRHDFINSKALYKFLTVRQETVSARPWTGLPKVPQIMNEINTSLVGAKDLKVGGFVTIAVIVAVVWLGWRKTALLVSWLGFSLIGFGIYKQHIYDHYFGFVFAVPFLLIGGLASSFYHKNNFLKLISIVLIGALVYINLAKNPLKLEPNRQLARSQQVAQKVLLEDGDKPFDLAVLAERNYEDGYRYFLELWGGKVLHADRWDQKTIVDQLFVICEMEEKKCDPTHSPKAEVANFGMSKIDTQWVVDGVIIYKLSHTQ